MVACGRVVLAVGTWYCTSSTRELSCGAAKRARVWWATGICCGPALGGGDTLGSGGRRLLWGGCGCSLKDEPRGCGLKEPAWMQGWSWGAWHRCWQWRGQPRGGTRHILFTVVLFQYMKRVVWSILCGYWSRGSAALRGR
jgi:hypothetical protein